MQTVKLSVYPICLERVKWKNGKECKNVIMMIRSVLGGRSFESIKYRCQMNIFTLVLTCGITWIWLYISCELYRRNSLNMLWGSIDFKFNKKKFNAISKNDVGCVSVVWQDMCIDTKHSVD